MAGDLKILQLPLEWGGTLKCDSAAFVHGGTAKVPVKRNCASCSRYVDGVNYNKLCKCHKYCQNCCGVSRNVEANVLYEDVKTYKDIIAPFLNICVSDYWTKQVLDDCRNKLNAVDPNNGFGVLHGLLVAGDDVDLMWKFLEIGVDTEFRYIFSDGHTYESESAMKPKIGRELNGGTALHFAAKFGRPNCFLALIDAGAELDAKTLAGKTVKELATDSVIKEIMKKANATGKKNLAALAKEGNLQALRHAMRSGPLGAEDFAATCDKKTALEWIWSSMCSWNFARSLDEDSLASFKIMSEIKFRYGVDSSNAKCPTVNIAARHASGSSAGEMAMVEVAEAVKSVSADVHALVDDVKVVFGSLIDAIKDLKTLTQNFDASEYDE